MTTVNKQSHFIAVLLKNSTLSTALLVSLLAVFYWGFVASDRYISESHVLIQRTDLASAQTMDIGSLLGNADSGDRADQLILRDYLLSIDMLKKLDKKLNLRAHYSDQQLDPLSRLWSEDVELEKFYKYYLFRVSVEFDDYAGVLVIKAQGYDPKTAHAIATFLVQEGEHFMNKLAHDLAQEQVEFLGKEIEQIKEDAMQARQAVLNFQNENGLVSPQGTTENVANIINRMEAQLTDLQTNRAAMLGYLMPDSANIAELNLQIAAIEKQITREKARLTSPSGKTLNRAVEEYQRLQMNAEFAQDIYKTALIGMEKGRLEASRTLKKMSILQAPTVPEYSLEPRRLYNTFVFVLVTFMIAGIVHLLAAIIRDHKD
ncbi:MAG: chain-length determining protein [Methylobacter sp.]